MKQSVNVVIANSDGEVLVLKRSLDDRSYPGCWDLPGGRVEENESLQKAAEREVAEEAGLEVKLENEYFRTTTYSDGEVNYVFTAQLLGGNVRMSQEHSEYKWVLNKDWPSLEYTPDVKETLAKYFNL